MAVRLAVRDHTIELFVDVEGEALLVDPAWVSVAPLGGHVYDHAAARLTGGRVLATGGFTQSPVGPATSKSFLYDVAANHWEVAQPMLQQRANLTLTALTDGTALAAGGETQHDQLRLSTAEIFDPSGLNWMPTAPMTNERAHHTATAPAGRGGARGRRGERQGRGRRAGSIRFCEVFDTKAGSGAWATTASMHDPRSHHTATRMNDGQVLVAGGSFVDVVHATAELYNPVQHQWHGTASGLITGRRDHAAVLLPGGGVLIMGGSTQQGPVTSTAEIYDRTNGTWKPTGNMALPRRYHTASLVSEGVLVAGGDDGVAPLASAEIYDLATGMWKPAPSLLDARTHHPAVDVESGVMVIAGLEDQPIDAVEVYGDKATGGGACNSPNDCPPSSASTGSAATRPATRPASPAARPSRAAATTASAASSAQAPIPTTAAPIRAAPRAG